MALPPLIFYSIKKVFIYIFYVIIIIAASAMLVMKVLDYNVLKLILVPNLTMEAAIMKLSAPRLDLAVTTVRAVMVSVVMVLCVLQLILAWSKVLEIAIAMQIVST